MASSFFKPFCDDKFVEECQNIIDSDQSIFPVNNGAALDKLMTALENAFIKKIDKILLAEAKAENNQALFNQATATKQALQSKAGVLFALLGVLMTILFTICNSNIFYPDNSHLEQLILLLCSALILFMLLKLLSIVNPKPGFGMNDIYEDVPKDIEDDNQLKLVLLSKKSVGYWMAFKYTEIQSYIFAKDLQKIFLGSFIVICTLSFLFIIHLFPCIKQAMCFIICG